MMRDGARGSYRSEASRIEQRNETTIGKTAKRISRVMNNVRVGGHSTVPESARLHEPMWEQVTTFVQRRVF